MYFCCNFISNQKLSKLLSKGFERLVYWNEYERKRDKKNATNRYLDVLSNQIVLDSKDYLLLFIQTKMLILKDLKLNDIIYQKVQ